MISNSLYTVLILVYQCCIAGKFGKENVLQILFIFSECLVKKVWRMNTSAKTLLIVSTNLNDFSLANHGWFIKFAKHSPSNFPTVGELTIKF